MELGRLGRSVTAIWSAMCCASLLGCALACAPAAVKESRVRVSVLPDASAQTLRERYAPLVDYLAETTGYEVVFALSPDYESLLDDFDAGRVDLAWFGGLTFARARARSGAQALVTRDIDVAFTSNFVANGAVGEHEIEAFRGRRFAFGPRLSTSGHLMPRTFLEVRGIVAEQFFSEIRYSGGHDESVRWVRDGVVDLAAVNSSIHASMIEEGSLALDAVRTIESTGPYQNYVWATRPGLHRDTRLALRNAFLALDTSEPADAAVMRGLQADGYLPIDASAYERLEAQANKLDLLGHAR